MKNVWFWYIEKKYWNEFTFIIKSERNKKLFYKIIIFYDWIIEIKVQSNKKNLIRNCFRKPKINKVF